MRKALAPELGRSLLAVSGSDGLTAAPQSIPDVVSVRFDRSFPHTLQVTVTPERAVLLLRQGTTSWVVSARGRVMRRLADPKRSSPPAAVDPKRIPVTVGETLPRLDGALAAAAVAPDRPACLSRRRPDASSATASSLTLVLGRAPRSGSATSANLGLKLAIAERVLASAAQHERHERRLRRCERPGAAGARALQTLKSKV